MWPVDHTPADHTEARRRRPAQLDRKRVVVAVGGNATYPPGMTGSAEEQFAIIDQSCEHLVRMIEQGYRLVLTHGNGPVVGKILFRMAMTAAQTAPMPMDVCVAHSQGGIGYMLQQSLSNRLRAHGLDLEAVSVITQVEVAEDDPAFRHPTKPIGRFFSEADAARIGRETGWEFVEDSGRGYRRVVPSPHPLRILEIAAVQALMDAGTVPIAVGGGGIPVVKDADGRWKGAAAVIDKDFASALLAAEIGAGSLLILTGVDRVAVDYGKPTQRFLDRLSAEEARRHLAEDQFPDGSMGPKIKAALEYLETTGGRVIITSLEKAFEALEDRAGTRILP